MDRQTVPADPLEPVLSDAAIMDDLCSVLHALGIPIVGPAIAAGPATKRFVKSDTLPV